MQPVHRLAEQRAAALRGYSGGQPAVEGSAMAAEAPAGYRASEQGAFALPASTAMVPAADRSTEEGVQTRERADLELSPRELQGA